MSRLLKSSLFFFLPRTVRTKNKMKDTSLFCLFLGHVPGTACLPGVWFSDDVYQGNLGLQVWDDIARGPGVEGPRAPLLTPSCLPCTLQPRSISSRDTCRGQKGQLRGCSSGQRSSKPQVLSSWGHHGGDKWPGISTHFLQLQNLCFK